MSRPSLVSVVCFALLQTVGCASPAPSGDGSSSGGTPGGGQSSGAGGTSPTSQSGGSGGGSSATTTGGTGGGTADGGSTGNSGGATGAGGSGGISNPGPSEDAGSPDTKPTTMDAPVAPDVAGETPGAPDAALGPKDYVCSWVIGITTTGEWYRAGFENVVDNARWQVTPIEMGHLEKWADPANPIWNEAIQSPCTRNSKTPDRIAFNATKYEWTTLEEFVPAYINVIKNIKTKYPSVKRIDLMTYGRAPGNKECAGANRPTYSWIKPVQDDAAAMVAAMYPGFVFVCPKWEHKSCSDFGLCPHVSAAANATLAKTIGEYFLQN